MTKINRYEIPSDKKDSTYVDIDVTLGDNRLNENVVNLPYTPFDRHIERVV